VSNRQNFSDQQRQSAYQHNAQWLMQHKVDGVEIALEFQSQRAAGLVYYCENCLFCHTDRSYFDVDHLVPDQQFKLWNKHLAAKDAVNMIILCKSRQRGDLGCNQSKGARLYVPARRGLAHTLRTNDMNCCPLRDRPFTWV
jgi:hypothetical protein